MYSNSKQAASYICHELPDSNLLAHSAPHLLSSQIK